MTERTIHAVAETGTISTSAPNPHVDLDGALPANYPMAQLVSAAMANSARGTFSIVKTADPTTFVIYEGVTFTTGTPNILDLSTATLVTTGSGGSPVNTDPVTVHGLAPAVSTTRAEINAAISGSTIEVGRMYYISDEQHFVLGTSANTIREYDSNLGNNPAADSVEITITNGTNTTIAAAGASAGVATAAQVTAWDGKLSAVVEDTAPVLGGDLNAGGANNRVISFTNLSNVQQGIVGYVDATHDGIALVRKLATEAYNPSDGGVLIKAGEIAIGGTAIILDQLQHSQAEGYRTLNVAQNGAMFAMEPPAPGWTANTTSTFQHDFGDGKDLGPWVQVTGLTLNPTQDVAAGDRLDLQVNVKVNNTEDKTGTLIIGFGIDGASPTGAGVSNSIPGESDIIMPVSISSTTHGGITTAQTVDIWARRGASQDDAHLYLRGDLAVHEFFLSVPGEAGSGGWTNGTTIGYWNLTRQDLGSVSGAQAVDLDAGSVITATMTGVTTFTFSSSAGMTNMPFWLLLDTGGFSPTFAYTGKNVHDPADVSWSASTSNIYSVAFMMIGNDVDYSQNWRP